jgi:quercetin dioxygenase-like cupin family protein
MPVFKENMMIPEKVSHSVERRIINLENLMVVVIDFTNGPMLSPDPPHNHPHEQISYVAEGELYVFIGDERQHLVKGDLFSVPSGIPHNIQTISSSVRLIDSFYPLRKDFIKNQGHKNE